MVCSAEAPARIATGASQSSVAGIGWVPRARRPAAPAKASSSTTPACPAGDRPPAAQGSQISVAARMQMAIQSGRRSCVAMISVTDLPVEAVLSGAIAEGAEIDPQELRRPGLLTVRLREGVLEKGLFDLVDHLFQIQSLGRDLPRLRKRC